MELTSGAVALETLFCISGCNAIVRERARHLCFYLLCFLTRVEGDVRKLAVPFLLGGWPNARRRGGIFRVPCSSPEASAGIFG
jgi:hypothetical protein